MKKIQLLSVDKLANSMTNRFQSKTIINLLIKDTSEEGKYNSVFRSEV